MNNSPGVRRERFGAIGVFIFPMNNGEPRSYLEFPNHQFQIWRFPEIGVYPEIVLFLDWDFPLQFTHPPAIGVPP